MRNITHDPDAVLDYKWDWTDWLEPGDSIVSHTINVYPAGLVVQSSTSNGSTVTAWISGGDEGVGYEVTCHIVTAGLREDDRTMRLNCWDR